jgi:hypothetical protein
VSETVVTLYCVVCGQKVRVRGGDWIDPMRFVCSDRERHEEIGQAQLPLGNVERVEEPAYDPEQAAIPY